MRARLTIETGDGSPAVCDLDSDHPVTLGRNRTNSIILQDKHASRWHAEVYHADGRWLVRDCDTLNGTKLNGERVRQPTPLGDGHEISIGDTRLRFTLEDTSVNGVAPAPELANGQDTHPGLGSSSDLSKTALHEDALTVLCDFMSTSMEDASPRALVRRALAAVHHQVGATLTGFLSLDQNDPLPKMVVPELAHVDVHLSRQLTQQVERDRRPVWLGANIGEAEHSDSFLPFKDAVCVPLRAEGAPLGALHVYKSGKLFTEREVRFCEVLAGFLANSLHVLRSRRTLEAENSRLRVHAPAATHQELVGVSPALQQLRQHIDRLAPRANTVLIVGESGVGKELVAQALHRRSPRRDGPLVVVNCASIAGSLAEAELFGQCQGAFTGADRDRPGYFQQADEGTLFLDELGELTLECQAKLLRVMEGKGFRPVGATHEVNTDVRIVAATNRNLECEVEAGRFRRDLFFRLGIPIQVPPLREHAADIPALVSHFLTKLTVPYHRTLTLTPQALERLQKYPWPGNVRQLWSVLEHAVIMSEGEVLDLDDLRLPEEAGADGESDLDLERVEARTIREALRRRRGNVSQAALMLGIHRETLVSKMKRHGIDRNDV